MGIYQDVFKHWNLDHVINACGTKTGIGASRVRQPVIEAVDSILSEFVSIDQLQARASQVISRIIGTEAGCVTACSASALTTGVAATITGSDLAAIEKMPDCGTRQNRVAIQMGHMINYGAPIPQAIRLSGAELIPLGTAAMCEAYHLEEALLAGLASAVYVVSHHTVREGELPMDLFIETCHRHKTPVIVDMASEYDMKTPVELGADLVIYSGHKFMCGTTSGIAAGNRSLVQATYLQNRGIGRVMKVGKESIVGALAALELWSEMDHTRQLHVEQKILDLWTERLKNQSGLSLSLHRDWTGNPITRLKLSVDPAEAALYAWELSGRLAGRKPAIIVRDDLAEKGCLFLDPCNLDRDEAQLVADAVIEELNKAKKELPDKRLTWSAVKRHRSLDPLKWPTDD
ncbi:MAG: aminotransferase class V-fold PLP-dependent enzyme [bacterium]